MRSVLTKVAILFGAMLATLLTVLAMKGLVHEESHRELGVVTIALADRHQTQAQWANEMRLRCACVDLYFPDDDVVPAPEGMGCNPRLFDATIKTKVVQCNYQIKDNEYRPPMPPRKPTKGPAMLFRVDQ
ncbi:hypothetical protein PVT67_13365 [Gallaecimonas kandeliae]|uniref:hypothetical protein n=1 Tax=Gallaecimonas kandeliae TaxID=3029055 RepID=UPI002647B2D8|nr:hypothetical protein [Gallaecimonas kandeliae]WKE64650.1 hypothetical protein PVT67_13365 [Gallaecimonas kandeliae]